MVEEITPGPTNATKIRIWQVLLIVLITILVTVAITFWFVRTYIYAKDFEPVELTKTETIELNRKLKTLGYEPEPVKADSQSLETDRQWLKPDPYRESDADREVKFSERELNSIIANNSDLARRLAIDLSDDLISARILVPLDPDFPILGGKTLRISTGLEMSFNNARPKVILKGVSLMGVPFPAAWLGGLKNIDLIEEFGDQGGFWSGFAEGVENIEVEQGHFKISLKK